MSRGGCLLPLLLLVVLAPAWAQTGGVIAGRVVDETGGVLPGVIVDVQSGDTVLTAVTDL
jgi:hypothetical protein